MKQLDKKEKDKKDDDKGENRLILAEFSALQFTRSRFIFEGSEPELKIGWLRNSEFLSYSRSRLKRPLC